MRGKLKMQCELHVGLPEPELAKRASDRPMPGDRRRNSDSKRTGVTEGDALGASLGLIDVLQDASCVGQEQLPGRAQLDAPREALEQRTSDFFFQILYLAGQRGLRDMETLRGSAKMLLFSNAHEIAKMA